MENGKPPPEDSPGSLKEAGEWLFRAAWRRGIQQQGWRRALLIVVVALAVVVAARLNFLGDDAHRVSSLLLPWHISAIDPERPMVPLSVDFAIRDAFGERTLRDGATCRAGEEIVVTWRTGVAAWVTVFGVDATGPYPLFRDKLEPGAVAAEPYRLAFPLDDTIGIEILYVIASDMPFSFAREVQPHLPIISPIEGSRGRAPLPFSLPLPEGLVAFYVTCEHLLAKLP